MIGDTLNSILHKYPLIFKTIDKSKITYLLKEIIIMEILNSNRVLTSREIQDEYLKIFNKQHFDEEWFFTSNSTQKSKLKVCLNNIMSSNLHHYNGLIHRNELSINKNGSNYEFTKSEDIKLSYENIFNEDKEINIFKMVLFHEKYRYIVNFHHLIQQNKYYCGKNSNHIDNDGIYPVFKEWNEKLFDISNTIFLCNKCLCNYFENNYKKLKEDFK